MKKKDILKMTGLTEKEFYERYPTEESFMMEYGGKIPMYSTGSYSAKAAAAGKDIGKPGKNFAKIAEEAGERYGSEEAGERVAGAILANLRKHRKGGSITPTPTGDIFDMMGMSYVNRFQEGGDIDVKAPRYDETELPPTMNSDVYGSGSGIHIKPENRGKFTAWASSRGMSVPEAASRVMSNTDQYSPGVVRMANFAKNAAGWNKSEMGGYYNMGGLLGQYGMGGNVPAYAFGDIVKKIGAGAYGVGEGLLDTVTMGATDQLTDMGYEGLQSLGGSKGKDNRTEDMIRGFGTTAGAVTGTVINPAATGTAISQGAKGLGQGISLAAPESQAAQAIGQFLPMAGNIAGMVTGSPAAGSAGAAKSTEFASTGFGKMAGQAGQAGQMFNQISPLFGMFGGQNAMGTPMKNGGMTSGYMKNMPTFAQGGMTVGNVEARELLIDPDQYGGGGVPKVLTSYSSPNLPSHPKDGSIDDRGTVPLPEGKFIITQAESNRYKTAARSNDKLMADAITNNIQVKKDKKEAEQMQKASNAYERFMSKYGGTIQKMYACGGKTYGCGGSVGKYAVGAGITSLPTLNTPAMGSSLSQGWNLGTGTLPSSGMGNFNAPFMQSYGEPVLNTPAMGSSLPQGWNLSKTPATVDTSGMFDAYRAANPTNATASTGYSSDMFMPSAIRDYNRSLQQNISLSDSGPYASGYKGGITNTNTNTPSPSPGNKFGDYATMGMMFAPAAYNIGRGLFSKVTQVPKGLGMVDVNITAPRMTDAKGRREIREQMNLAKYNAGQLGGANILPGYATLGTAGMKAVSDYTENLRNKQAAMDYDAAVTKQKLELANAQQSAANWAMQQQMQAQKDNILAAGLGNLGEIGGQLRREKVMGDVYRDLYTNYDYINGRWTPKATTTKLT